MKLWKSPDYQNKREALLEKRKQQVSILNLFKEKFTKREIIIQSNIYYDRHVRKYFVKEVKEEYKDNSFYIKLYNPALSSSSQVCLPYPKSVNIEELKEGPFKGKQRITLNYSQELQSAFSLHSYMRKKTEPDISDLEIYIIIL